MKPSELSQTPGNLAGNIDSLRESSGIDRTFPDHPGRVSGKIDYASSTPAELSERETSLALCIAPHPFGVTYRLQSLNDDDNIHGNPARQPRRLYCPWCDYDRLYVQPRNHHGGTVEPEPVAGDSTVAATLPIVDPGAS